MEDGSGLEDEGSDVHIDIPLDNYEPPPEAISDANEEVVNVGEATEYAGAIDSTFQDNTLDRPDEQLWEPTIDQDSRGVGAPAGDFSSPASISELTRRHDSISHGHLVWPTFSTPLVGGGGVVTSPAGSLPTPETVPLPKPSRREAFLLHHFVRKIAPWVGYHERNASLPVS